MLRVRLFGGLALESDGVALPMPERRRACSLLGWLALHPGMHPRSEIAGRFWPNVLDSSARKSLRTELVAVRRALPAAGEGVLIATRDMVGLAGDGVFVDAREFDRLVRNGRLKEAVDLCEGELLEGLDDEWVYEARELHRHHLGDVLERIATDAESAGALTGAIRISRRRVELDPLREDAHRELIRRLIAAGEASAARLAFDDLARRLRTDLQVAPSRADPPPARGHSYARRRSSPGDSRVDAAPSPGAGEARAQPVRRPGGPAWLASGSVVRGSAWIRSACGHRRRSGNRQDAAGERICDVPLARRALPFSSAIVRRRC